MRAEAESIIDEITDLLRRLSSAERRVLQRRLRVSGLSETEELVADRNRLEVATALGTQVAESMSSPRSVAPSRPAPLSPSVPELGGDAAVDPDASELTVPDLFTGPSNRVEAEGALPIPPNPSLHSAYAGEEVAEDEYADLDESTEYQSAVSGRVVVGVPDNSEAGRPPSNPHMMPPLPGQAPEQPIRVVFGGGSKRENPGIGYGSYALDWPGLPRQIVQLQFGNRVTDSVAEYDTLIAALEGIVDRLEDQSVDPATAQLDIRGDAELVIRQVRGEAECKNNRLRRDRVIELLDDFEDWSLTLHGREQGVRILGH